MVGQSGDAHTLRDLGVVSLRLGATFVQSVAGAWEISHAESGQSPSESTTLIANT